ncbi:hypothetical protein L6164_004101 [Bauhinia variegata]|uniref:Uncharacterized protein n=1 Tax=Bauhinia variegata TaxID=167791 RepID=A0ACB9Q3D2_BAUVA|nr:hypothetical protein L6164_004101 [Bauhinia variegata]
MEELELEKEKEDKSEKKDGGSSDVISWDKFLPRTVIRVLLVEADDSTRQIISALLRKCSYRVAAVADGLKAWETLKRKAPDIDLILTEVELPSISGFALLTLVMEHDACKNIPVIMMSSQDSISMVLKCMLKGAADFLIKPVRRNELRNLWQHVWRRRHISGHPQNITFPKKKLEASSENNTASNHSSGSVASPQKNDECTEKGSKAQGPSQLKYRSYSSLSNIDIAKNDKSSRLNRKQVKHNNDTGEKSITFVSEAATCNEPFNSIDLRLEQGHGCAKTETRVGPLRSELSRGNPNIDTEMHGCNLELEEPSRGAIDLIATLGSLPKNIDGNSGLIGGGTNKFDFDPQLELSLRRDFPSSSCKQATEERQTLNHSNASAFSWYSGSKLLRPPFPSPSSSTGVKDTRWNSHVSTKLSGNDIDTSRYGGKNPGHENMTSPVVGQSVQTEVQLPNGQHGSFPASTAVTSDHMSSENGHVLPSVFYTQSGGHPIWSPKPVYKKENSPLPTSSSFQSNPESHNSEQCYHWSDDATYSSIDQTVDDKSNLDSVRHDSPAAGKNTSNSLCHDTANHINSSAYSGSDGNTTSAMVVENIHEKFSENGRHNSDGLRGMDSHRGSQREAALTKFRLKRKDRCFEKKVRYQSRKRLAEQRPRVKGQFVRQVQNDHPVANAAVGSCLSVVESICFLEASDKKSRI